MSNGHVEAYNVFIRKNISENSMEILLRFQNFYFTVIYKFSFIILKNESISLKYNLSNQ